MARKTKKTAHPRIDKQFRHLLPQLDESEYAILEKSCLKDGIRDSIKVWKGHNIVVDGMNRLQIAKKHNLPYRMERIEFPDRKSIIAWILEYQLARRNISLIQKVLLALQLETYYQKKAKENQKLSQGKGVKGCKRRKQPFVPIDTLAEIGKLADCSRTVVCMVKRIKKDGGPELLQKCIDEKMSIRTAYFKAQDIFRHKSRKTAAHKTTKFNNPRTGKYVNEIHCGDSIALLKKMRKTLAEKISLVVCSPPYYNCNEEYGPGYNKNRSYKQYINWLGRVMGTLSPLMSNGGKVVINVNTPINAKDRDKGGDYKYPIQADLIAQVRHLDCGLRYFTDIIWHKTDTWGKKVASSHLCCPKRPSILNNHEYLMVWAKNEFELENIAGMPGDVTAEEWQEWMYSVWSVYPVTRTKIPHPCTFPVRLVDRIIKMFSYRSDIVLDPFVGSGTATACAAALGRQWIGIDQNPTYCKFAKKRTVAEARKKEKKKVS